MESNVPLRPFVTLRAGGPAERFAWAETADDLGRLAEQVQTSGDPMTVLGWGSNVLPSDRGVPGLTVLNRARRIAVARDGQVVAETGCGFQDLFLAAAQRGLGGLAFAVGIPGTLGGALASNAGAYRSCVSEFLTEVQVVFGGRTEWVPPTFLEFSYRDSRLRQPERPPVTVLRVRMRLPAGDPKAIYDEAREYQRQRISKQPPPASAGSFFKNVNDRALCERLPDLPEALRKAGVVPAGYLIEAVGLKGYRQGGAAFGARHANFLMNVGNATASELRNLARFAQEQVFQKFGVALEEEVLYLGDWA